MYLISQYREIKAVAKSARFTVIIDVMLDEKQHINI